MRHARLALPAFGVALLIGAPVAQAAPEAAEAPRGGIEIGYLNRSYVDLEGEIAPIREGPLEIRLASPEHRVQVHHNRLVFEPRGSGDPGVYLALEAEGEGNITADVRGGPMETRFQDRVEAPRQRIEVRGTARVTRHAEGYRILLVEGPPSIPVRIRSGVIGSIVGFCRKVAFFGGLDCESLQRALSTVRVPLRHGTAVDLPRARLSAPERAYLDRFARPVPAESASRP